MTLKRTPEITLLNGMLGSDFLESLSRHQKLGIGLLDLKDHVLGKSFADLTTDEAHQVLAMIREKNMEVYTLSSGLCHMDVEGGESAFRQSVEAEMKRVLAVAAVLRPESVLLLSAWSSRRADIPDSLSYLDRHHPWIYRVYQECIAHLREAGCAVFIENEAHQNIFSNTTEIRGFFNRLDCGKEVGLTWDIQNLWQMGTYPTVAIYEEIKDLTQYLHFKGGQQDELGKLMWASSLEDASWPVVEIVRRAIAVGSIRAFCLNPSHGKQKDGYSHAEVAERDIHFLQKLIRMS